MFQRSATSECGVIVTQHTTTTIQYERHITDGTQICSRKQRTKYERRPAIRRGSKWSKMKRQSFRKPGTRNTTRERFSPHSLRFNPTQFRISERTNGQWETVRMPYENPHENPRNVGESTVRTANCGSGLISSGSLQNKINIFPAHRATPDQPNGF